MADARATNYHYAAVCSSNSQFLAGHYAGRCSGSTESCLDKSHTVSPLGYAKTLLGENRKKSALVGKGLGSSSSALGGWSGLAADKTVEVHSS